MHFTTSVKPFPINSLEGYCAKMRRKPSTFFTVVCGTARSIGYRR